MVGVGVCKVKKSDKRPAKGKISPEPFFFPYTYGGGVGGAALVEETTIPPPNITKIK